MRFASIGLFLATLSLTIVGSKMSPDYYARTPETVRRWAYSNGLWIVLLSVVLSMALGYVAYRLRSGWSWTAALLSALISLVWIVRPYLFSLLGDILFWRFP